MAKNATFTSRKRPILLSIWARTVLFKIANNSHNIQIESIRLTDHLKNTFQRSEISVIDLNLPTGRTRLVVLLRQTDHLTNRVKSKQF